jgi:hypothetical protein
MEDRTRSIAFKERHSFCGSGKGEREEGEEGAVPHHSRYNPTKHSTAEEN